MFGIDFKFQHLFSAEIVPFKQAYIERNFHPPLIFRDVTQMQQSEAYVYNSCHTDQDTLC